jgi:hypothetical protein
MRRFGVTVEEQEDSRGDWYLAKQIAVGILIAAAAIFVGLHVYAYFVAKAAERAAAEFMQQAQQDLQEHSAAVRSQIDVQRAADRAAAERRAAAELKRRQVLARQTQAAADQAELEQANAAAKQHAWQQFYRPAKKCENPPDWNTHVDCGNAHMKAKREFEDRWARGDI